MIPSDAPGYRIIRLAGAIRENRAGGTRIQHWRIEMIGFLNIPEIKASDSKPCKLRLEIDDSGRPTGRFEPNELIVSPLSTLDIELRVDKAPESLKSIQFHGYCTTDIDPERIKAVSVHDSSGQPTVIRNQDDAFPADASRVFFTLGKALPQRLLIFIGLIVKLDRGKGDEYFLYDPQVGNGPPGSSQVSALVPLK